VVVDMPVAEEAVMDMPEVAAVGINNPNSKKVLNL